MLCKENYKVVIIIKFLLHQSIVPKYSSQCFIKIEHQLELLKLVYIMFFFFMKKNSYSYKLRYEGYLELICRCLSDDMYTKLTHMKISYRVISCVYGKSHIKVV